MNDQVKILLTIELAGGTLVRQSKKEKIYYKLTEREVFKKKKDGTNWGKGEGMDKVVRQGVRVHRPLTPKPAQKNVKLSRAAYNHFTDADAVPFWEKNRDWSKLTKKQRIQSHVKRIAEHSGGTSFWFEILQD